MENADYKKDILNTNNGFYPRIVFKYVTFDLNLKSLRLPLLIHPSTCPQTSNTDLQTTHSPLIHHHSNSAWWFQTCWVFSLSGAEADGHPDSQPSPPSPPVPHCLSPFVHPVPYPPLQFVYPLDIPRCRSWRNPRRASPWTPVAQSRSGQCRRRQGGAWASRSGSGCCSHRSKGCSPARASVGSRGPPVHHTGSNGGCCWTGQAHGGTAGLQMQLGREEK